ncbi:uncharacterized protein [Physcomitrium patens]|uniref:Uncharacterized protein n=1 Tax=Physcomitrium patens TaxID=3218 RepID=A0A7I4BYE8_PHYPA
MCEEKIVINAFACRIGCEGLQCINATTRAGAVPYSVDSGSVEQSVVNLSSQSCRSLFNFDFLIDCNQDPSGYGFRRSLPESYRSLKERLAGKYTIHTCAGYGVEEERTSGSLDIKLPKGWLNTKSKTSGRQISDESQFRFF